MRCPDCLNSLPGFFTTGSKRRLVQTRDPPPALPPLRCSWVKIVPLLQELYLLLVLTPFFLSFTLHLREERKQKTQRRGDAEFRRLVARSDTGDRNRICKAKELITCLFKLNREPHIQRQLCLHGPSPVFPSPRLCVSAFISLSDLINSGDLWVCDFWFGCGQGDRVGLLAFISSAWKPPPHQGPAESTLLKTRDKETQRRRDAE